MPAPVTGYTANLVNDIVRDAGRVVINGVILSILRGGARFDPNRELVNIGVGLDGVDAPILGLDQWHYNGCLLTFTISELGGATTGNQLAKLEPGSSSADTGVTPDTKTTITPKTGRTLFVAADYLTDVYLVSTYSRAAAVGVKGYPSLHLPKAIVRKWDIQTVEKDKANISVEIQGRIDPSSGGLAKPDYDIVLWETAP